MIKFILSCLLLLGLIFYFEVFATLAEKVGPDQLQAVSGESTEMESDYSLAMASGDHDSNTCFFEHTEMFDETVTIVYPEENLDDNVIGTWQIDTNTISLMQPGGLNIQTVAHEVSHMVDDYMEKYQVKDPHYRQYMQGYWTWCVWEILQEDMAESAIRSFRFAH